MGQGTVIEFPFAYTFKQEVKGNPVRLSKEHIDVFSDIVAAFDQFHWLYNINNQAGHSHAYDPIIAGGAIRDTILQTKTISDIDIYFYGNQADYFGDTFVNYCLTEMSKKHDVKHARQYQKQPGEYGNLVSIDNLHVSNQHYQLIGVVPTPIKYIAENFTCNLSKAYVDRGGSIHMLEDFVDGMLNKNLTFYYGSENSNMKKYGYTEAYIGKVKEYFPEYNVQYKKQCLNNVTLPTLEF